MIYERSYVIPFQSLSSENLATIPPAIVTDAVPYSTPTDAIERVRQTKPAWSESRHALHTSAEGEAKME